MSIAAETQRGHLTPEPALELLSRPDTSLEADSGPCGLPGTPSVPHRQDVRGHAEAGQCVQDSTASAETPELPGQHQEPSERSKHLRETVLGDSHATVWPVKAMVGRRFAAVDRDAELWAAALRQMLVGQLTPLPGTARFASRYSSFPVPEWIRFPEFGCVASCVVGPWGARAPCPGVCNFCQTDREPRGGGRRWLPPSRRLGHSGLHRGAVSSPAELFVTLQDAGVTSCTTTSSRD